MNHLDSLRRLKRDPAAFGRTEKDPSGHTFSPSLKQQQRELDAKFEEADALALKAKAEFEQRYAEGFALREEGNADKALEHFAAAYVLARELNYRAGEADALNMTGVCYKHRGELERAASVFEGCAQLCASMKDAHGEAAALGNLGQALAAQRRLAEAEAAHERSLELARSNTGTKGSAQTDGSEDAKGDRSGQLSALFHLGTLRLRMQRFVEAEACLTSAQSLADALGDVAAEVGVLQRLAAARDALEQQCQQTRPPIPHATPHQQPPPPASGGGFGAPAATRAGGTGPVLRPGNRASVMGEPTQDLGASLPARPSSRFVLEPNPDLSASLQQRRLAVELPPSVPTPPAPLPPLQPEKLPPLALLVRAEVLTREITQGGESLRMQVLRQLRAQYGRMGNEEGIKACEREIDALHEAATKRAAQQRADEKRKREAEEQLAAVSIAAPPAGGDDAKTPPTPSETPRDRDDATDA